MANKKNGSQEENQELSAEDYAIIAAGLTALGDFFAFLSLIKAREATKETGDDSGTNPAAFILSRKKR
jgi:hypothetical protein